MNTATAGIQVLRNLLHLRAAQDWKEDRLRNARTGLLGACVDNAIRHVPYFRELADELGISAGSLKCAEDLARLPVLTKEIVKSEFPDRLVKEGLDWEKLYSVATSGTTDRVMTFEDEERRNWDRAADLLIELRGNGFRPGDRSLSVPPDACYEHCGADGRMLVPTLGETFRALVKAPLDQKRREARKLRAVVMSDYVWRSKRLPSLGVDGTGVADEALRSYCEEIRKWKPRVLTGLPVTLYVIALYALRNRLEFPEVQVVRPNGGKFSEVMIEVVERAFGARVRENYGSAELSTMAHDCAASRDLHLLGEIVHLEILRNGQPVEGAEMGELVITDLRNHVTPLIRYAIGDVGRFVPGRCACGFEGTRFVVDGRLVETVVTPDRLAVPGTRLVDLFLRRPEIDHVKIRQQSDTLFLVEAVLAPGIDQAPEEAELAEMLGELLEHPVEVRLRVVRRIAPERNGKYCLVISNSHARFREA